MVVEHVCVCMHAIVNAFGLLSYLIFCKNVPRAANVSWDTTGTDKAEKVFYKPINDSFCRCAMVGKEKSVPWINLYHYEDRSVILENLDGESTESMVRYGAINGSEALYFREGIENACVKDY